MPAPLTWAELQVFEPELAEDMADAMITSVWARCTKVAPCLKEMEWSETESDEEYENTQLVKTIVRAAVLRWSDSGSGIVTQRIAGDYQETLSGVSGGGLLRPDEIRDLQQLCATSSTQAAVTVPTWPDGPYVTQHAAWCDVSFGGLTCDCGADLSATGLPLWTREP